MGTAATAATATALGTMDSSPRISGIPSTAVTAGDFYSFTPTASDASNDKLTFSVRRLPSWASFDPPTGEISGEPTAADIGTYNNIAVSVSDGSASVALTSFSITVDQTSNGSAQVSWTPPTENNDGSALTNLAGYWLYYGKSRTDLGKRIQIANAGISDCVVTNLSTGVWFFDVIAYNSAGTPSPASVLGSTIIK